MTPEERARAAQAEASALEPDHIGHGGPPKTGSPECQETHLDADEPEGE